MRTRIMIGLLCIVAAGWAAYKGDLAALYVTFVGYVIIYLLHTIEFKLNKLLDHYQIYVSQHDMAKD